MKTLRDEIGDRLRAMDNKELWNHVFDIVDMLWDDAVMSGQQDMLWQEADMTRVELCRRLDKAGFFDTTA